MTTRLQLIVSTIFLSLTVSAQVPNYVPTSSIVAWYSFNGNTNDLSGNNNTLTAVNGASLAPDRFAAANSSYSLDGVNDWLETQTNFYNPSIPHSISIWWRTSDSTKTNQTLYNTSPHTTENLAFHYHSSNPTPPYDLRFGLGNAGGSWTIMHPDNGTITVPPNFNVWHHAVLVKFDIGSNHWTYYHDGNAILTFSSGLNTPTVNAGIRFGAENNLPGGGAQFKGCLDDIGIWNRALTLCEVKQLYAAGLATINASTSNTLMCVGETVTLTATGGTSYTWNPGGIVATTIAVSPTATTNYSVVGTNSITTCTSNTTISQAVSPCTGISNNSLGQNFGISIFPNPSNGEFTISTATDINLTITNELGQIVKTISLTSKNNHRVSVSTLANGIYFVSGNNGSTSVKEKIIISK